MSANTNPIYSLLGDIQWATVTTAATAKDGTTATLLYTADVTNGSRVDRIKFRALGTNVATVARIFVNNGSTVGTATNNALIAERTLPATTLSEVAEILDQEISLEITLPPGYKLYVSIGTTVSAGYAITAIGGKY